MIASINHTWGTVDGCLSRIVLHFWRGVRTYLRRRWSALLVVAFSGRVKLLYRDLLARSAPQVIDEKMVEHRMAEQRRLRPSDGEFYIMELGLGLFVDAKEKGNLMRLINHRLDGMLLLLLFMRGVIALLRREGLVYRR